MSWGLLRTPDLATQIQTTGLPMLPRLASEIMPNSQMLNLTAVPVGYSEAVWAIICPKSGSNNWPLIAKIRFTASWGYVGLPPGSLSKSI